MDCTDVQHYLFDYGEGELAPGLIKSFEKHIQECENCSRLFKRYQSLETAIEEEKEVEPNPFAATRILQYIENSQQRRIRVAVSVLRPVLITLVLFLALAVGFLVGRMAQPSTSVGTSGNTEIDVLKSDLYIADFVDEDIVIETNY